MLHYHQLLSAVEKYFIRFDTNLLYILQKLLLHFSCAFHYLVSDSAGDKYSLPFSYFLQHTHTCTHTHEHTHLPPVLSFSASCANKRSMWGLHEFSIDSFYTHKLSSLKQKNTPSMGTFHPRCTHAFQSLFLDVNFRGILCSKHYLNACNRATCWLYPVRQFCKYSLIICNRHNAV